MLVPFLLIYSLYKSQISKIKLMQIMKFLVLIVSLIIIISNLFKFSYGNYSDIPIKANFFEWFNPNSTYSYKDLASKGLFEFGNQIGAILILFLPFILYSVFKKSSLINIFTLLCNTFALFLLCTRVSVIGVIIVFIYSVFTFIFINILEKNKINLKAFVPILIVLSIYIIVLPNNPMFDRLTKRTKLLGDLCYDSVLSSSNNIKALNDFTENTSTDNTILDSSSSDEDMIKYIENTYKNKQLHEQFLFKSYPYKYDVEFWYEFLQNSIYLTTDYRYVERSMIERIITINNNPLDKLFGITNTRIQNIFNVEKDFVVQYYALGIIGLFIVLAPYFLFIIIFVFNTLKSKFKSLTILSSLSFITIIFLFGISYMSGNLLNSLSFTIYFASLFYLLRRQKKFIIKIALTCRELFFIYN